MPVRTGAVLFTLLLACALGVGAVHRECSLARVTYRSDEGILTDGSPSDVSIYADGITCLWRIESPSGNTLQVDWIRLDTKNNLDHVRLCDCTPTPSCRAWEGWALAVKTERLFFDGCFEVNFEGGSNDDNTGFSLQWQPAEHTPVRQCEPLATKAVYRSDSGMLTDGTTSDVAQFAEGTNCYWRVESPSGKALQVEFLRVDVEYDGSRVHVCDCGPSQACYGQNGWRVVGATFQWFFDGCFEVRFDGSRNEDGTGFTLQWEPAPETVHRECSATRITHRSDGGILTDGSVDVAYYPSDVTCKWRIESPSNRVLQLDFIRIETESSKDYISLCDCSDTPACQSHFGWRLMGTQFRWFFDGCVDVDFNSRTNDDSTGFSMQWVALGEVEVPVPPKQCPADGVWLSVQEGTTSQVPCVSGGMLQRFCATGGVWAEVASGSCEDATCRAEGEWPLTLGNQTAARVCTGGLVGFRSRLCSGNGVWGVVDASACVVPPTAGAAALRCQLMIVMAVAMALGLLL